MQAERGDQPEGAAPKRRRPRIDAGEVLKRENMFGGGLRSYMCALAFMLIRNCSCMAATSTARLKVHVASNRKGKGHKLLQLLLLPSIHRKERGSWVAERDLEELFWRATDGPSEGGQAASAAEKATVQVRSDSAWRGWL